jgi:RNA polymerase-binding transcription factor DksA
MKPMIKTQKSRIHALLDEQEAAARLALNQILGRRGEIQSGSGHGSRERDYAEQAACYALEIERIAHARSRLAARTYGVCSECRVDIAFDRLVAHPTTLWCESCQLQFDQMKKLRLQPVARDHRLQV